MLLVIWAYLEQDLGVGAGGYQREEKKEAREKQRKRHVIFLSSLLSMFEGRSLPLHAGPEALMGFI